jgi:hypothetical protein
MPMQPVVPLEALSCEYENDFLHEGLRRTHKSISVPSTGVYSRVATMVIVQDENTAFHDMNDRLAR